MKILSLFQNKTKRLFKPYIIAEAGVNHNGDLKTTTVYPQVDVVLHLAAFNGTKYFYTKGYEVISNNIIPTLNILDYYKQQKKKPLIE